MTHVKDDSTQNEKFLAASSFCFPAEWAPQSAVMLTWPHDKSDWAPHLNSVEPVFVEIARHISQRQGLLIVARDETHKDHIRHCLSQAGIDADTCQLYQIPSNDTWARDHGPIGVYTEGKLHLLNFIFNAWGGKFPAHKDDAISRQLQQQGAFGDTPLLSQDLVLEGGALETDGQGTLLAVRRSLIDPARNPCLSQAQIESSLNRILGIRRFLWLDRGGLAGDDTDGHIDTLARFSSKNQILYQGCDNPDDPNHGELQAMAEELRRLKTDSGGPYRLSALPSPHPIYDEKGQQLPASYANFLIINGAVLVPTYGDQADKIALATIGQAFPEREIIGINCLPIIRQYGSLHCLTMQIPAVLDVDADNRLNFIDD